MSDKARWQDDPYFRQAASRLGTRGLVCVELFGVLLLPLYSEPDGVFSETGRRLAAEAPWPVSEKTFPALRKAALNRALGKKSKPTLEDVYRECCKLPWDSDRAAELELETLRDMVFLNPWAVDFIRHCRENGTRVSFFYRNEYSEQQMRTLLERSGFPAASDEPVSDAIPDGEMLCIVADDLDAITAGCDILWYGAPAETRRGPFAMEKHIYPDRPGELDALRAVAATAVPAQYRSEEQRVFYRTGAAVLGPVYTMYAQWICEQAKELGVRKVLAFMREGELLAPLIRAAAKAQGLELEVALFYTSRKACVLAGVAEPDNAFFKSYLTPRITLTIGDLFKNLELDIEKSPFRADSGKTLRQCSEEFRARLDEYLLSPEVQEQLRATIRERRAILTEYTRAATGGEAALTVDMGAHGTTAACIDRALSLSGYTGGRLYHLLLYGVPKNAEHILDGVYLRGFLGGCGENAERIGRIDRYFMVLESCCNSGCGTTVGYRRNLDGSVSPVLAEPTSTPAENSCRSACWEGIFRFQSAYHELARQKPWFAASLTERRASFAALLLRLYENPLHDEAVSLSDFRYEDQERSSLYSNLKNAESKALLDNADCPEDFLRERRFVSFNHFTWGEALVERRYPGYFLNRFLDGRDVPVKRKRRQRFFGGACEGKRVFIYGAGKAGRALAEQAWEVRFPLAGIADKSAPSPGKTVFGYPVMTPEESAGLADIYIITPIPFAGEITDLLRSLHQGREQPEVALRDEI